MDKQQAAHEYARNRVYDKNPADIAVESHIAGWDAHEAQSSSDAVAFADWKDGLYDCIAVNEHIEPFGSGDVKTTAELYKLFNPSGADPHHEKKSKGEILQEYLKDVKCSEDAYPGIMAAMDQYAEQERATPAPQAAGPVWVKASERLPLDEKSYPLKIDMGDFDIYGVGCYEERMKAFRDNGMNGLYHHRLKVQWLDEFVPQVFTRERVEAMLKDTIRHFHGINGLPMALPLYIDKWIEATLKDINLPPINLKQ